MDQARERQLGIPTPRSGDLIPIRRRRPVWRLGRVWTVQRVVGKLCVIRGIYGEAELVLANSDDPDVGDDRNGC